MYFKYMYYLHCLSIFCLTLTLNKRFFVKSLAYNLASKGDVANSAAWLCQKGIAFLEHIYVQNYYDVITRL